jgi:acetyl-CoA carboxylase carboxyl transferase subunit beta
MNWLRNVVKPKLRALVTREIPDNLWHKCPGCGQMIFHRELTENLHVCRQCGFHLKFDPKARLVLLYDRGQYERIALPAVPKDPLHFKDLKKYTDRLKDSRNKTQEEDALIIAFGLIGGHKAVTALFNFEFMGGSMGVAVGEGIVKAADFARENKAALIIIPASGGARMQEGILSLMQMARTTVAISQLRESRLPYITILTDPTSGGVTASFAMLGDITIAEPKATICFAGRRVIEQTIKQQLPANFQTSEYLQEHGMVDMVVARRDLKKKLDNLLSLLMNHKKHKK